MAAVLLWHSEGHEAFGGEVLVVVDRETGILVDGEGAFGEGWAKLVDPGQDRRDLWPDAGHIVVIGGGAHQARSPCRTPSLTTIWPSRAMVQRRMGRSKWPWVKRPAYWFAPVDQRKFPAQARNSTACMSRLS